jgi:NADH dehydrogenase [ubiquinone] 1 alpha subcomplex assembly factor 5
MTSPPPASPLFDESLQERRRARAGRGGWCTFLHRRVLDDLVDRLSVIQREFRRALVIGWPEDAPPAVAGLPADTQWRALPEQLGPDDLGAFDLLLLIGAVDSANDPRAVFHAARACLEPDSLLLGALAGGESLATLRRAMLAADSIAGRGAAPRTHPRIDPAAVAGLLTDAGFHLPVIDVDRVQLNYRSLDVLVRDLRGGAATNALVHRDRRPLGRAAVAAARAAFLAEGGIERVDLINFAGWTPAENNRA